MKYEDLTTEVIEKHIGKKFGYFTKHPSFPDYVRVHFDRERYLSNCIDIEIKKIKGI